MAKTENISAQARAQMFTTATRQHFQSLGKQAIGEVGQVTFNLPKARLLSKVIFRISGTYKNTGSTKATAKDFYKWLSRVKLDLNNGFAPFTLTGEALYHYMKTQHNNGYMSKVNTDSVNANSAFTILGVLPVALNDKDPIGYILLQNAETNVTLDITTGSMANIITGGSIESCSIEVMTESFSVPAVSSALPDLTVLKLVNSRNDVLVAGENTIKLSTGTIYRKILFMIKDASGNAVTDSDILSPFQLVFNQADAPYSVSAEMLRAINCLQYDNGLDKGVWALDFSAMQGFANYSGARDFIDSEKLTELWLKFTTTSAGTIEVISEKLSRLAK